MTRIKMKMLVKKQKCEKLWNARTISQADVPFLGVLMLESYKGTIDYEGETLKDAVEEVGATLKGKYGPFLRHCSFLIEEKGRILSTSLVVWSEKMNLPLLVYIMTHPDSANQGMATFLLKKSINALHTDGYKELCLVVTEGNTAAQHIYEKMGFQVCE